MKILFVGGTGTISMAISKRLLIEGHELYLLNHGSRNHELPEGFVHLDVGIDETDKVKEMLQGMRFDCVAEFIAFVPDQVKRDVELFKDITKQYIFISSASAYQKPLNDFRITEGTPLANPYWEYSRNKIACEDYLMQQYRDNGFPVTIVRPSHTYDERSIPLGIHGSRGSWQIAKRMIEGKPIIIHGDGTSLWTMTHNRDFAKAFVGLIGNCHAIGEAVQITSDETLTWNQIYDAVASALGVTYTPYYVSSSFLANCSDYDFKGSLLGDKANSVVFENTKLKRLVPGFHATTRFDQGVRETVEHILAHPEIQRSDPDFDTWCDKVIAALDQAVEQIIS